MKLNWIYVLLCIALLSKCVQYVKYIPDPEKDINMWIDNFKQQRSFTYQYNLKTLSVYTEAAGECIVNRSEHVKGIWQSDEEKLHFEYYGFGDREYSKEDGRWKEMSRGDESNIIAQIGRLFEFGKFEYICDEETYHYRFKANIPFLVPGRWKDMVGHVEISKRNYLPVLVWAGLPDSSVYWEITLRDYNKKWKIKAPVQEWNNYVLTDASEYLPIIKKRLKLIDVRYRIKQTGEDVVLSMPVYFTLGDIEEMFRPRTLVVYGLTSDKHAASKVGYLHGNINVPLYIVRQYATQNAIKDVKIKFDGSSRPFLELSLKDKQVLSETIAFEVDSTILSTATLDTLNKIDRIGLYSNMTYYDMQVLRAAFLQKLPPLKLRQSDGEPW